MFWETPISEKILQFFELFVQKEVSDDENVEIDEQDFIFGNLKQFEFHVEIFLALEKLSPEFDRIQVFLEQIVAQMLQIILKIKVVGSLEMIF